MKVEIETVRVAHERTWAARIERHPLFAPLSSQLVPADAKEVRRTLMARSLRLTESMAPDAYRVANEAKRTLAITGELELYQRSGAENASMHFVDDPILLEIHGSLLPRLDAPSMCGLFGHELGHYLAHGTASPVRRAFALMPALGHLDEPSLEFALSRLSMMAEITADRVGLLACQDFVAMLRLEMVALTGLSASELTWDTDAYLAQCRDLMEAGLRDGADVRGVTHPEHSLRAYALWLFSETKTYRELTGKGPGTREIADVDAQIARCFGDPADTSATSEGPLLLDHSRLGEPPRELHECALAASVIVAFADGEVSDEERRTLENQFATLVPDWRTYLDFDIALERFRETSGILIEGGADLSRSLFHVLVRVMASDGVVNDEEVSMVLAIGAAVGATREFRSGLAAVLKTIDSKIILDSVATVELPLPARRQDVDDAFTTFIAGIVRRGESTITLRRLLRLLGSDRRTDELVAKITAAFTDAKIECSFALATVNLDERLVLTAPAPVIVRATPTPMPPSRANLAGSLRRLREQLVSGDGRSPSVRLRTLRRGRAFDLLSLDKVSVGSGERVIAQVRARKTVRLVDAADAGKHGSAATASTELLALAREAAVRAEETGANDLFVGYPFVTGSVDGYLVRAPLVLYPVTLERDGAGARGYRLAPRRDEPAIANQSLIRLVFNKRGFAYSDELSDELEALAGAPDGGPEAVRKKLTDVGLATFTKVSPLEVFRDRDEELLSAKDGLEIEEVAVVGLFPQSSSDLLQDYDGLLQELADPAANVATLLAAASTLLPDSLTEKPVAAPAAPDATIADWAPVIPADPSQRSVITEARKNGATVIDGPPGTGKSQVIVNLVAEALRRGERVAVVCEKRAALDVVRQRLAAIGFGKALAVVHDVNEDRKPLYLHVATRIETKERIPFDASAATAVSEEHDRVRVALDGRSSALRADLPGLDLDLGELLSYAAGHARSSMAPVAGLDRVTQVQLRSLLDLVAALHPLADLWKPDGKWRMRLRPSLSTIDAEVVRRMDAILETAIAAAKTYEEHAKKNPVAIEVALRVRAPLAIAAKSRSARTAADVGMFGTIASIASTNPEKLRATSDAKSAYDEASTALVRLDKPVKAEASAEVVAALSVVTRWTGAWYRIFILGWWKARGKLRSELATLWPERAGDAFTSKLLSELADRIAASKAWGAIGGVFERLGLAHAVPSSAAQLAPVIDRVSTMSTALAELGGVRAELAAASAWIPAGAKTVEDFATWDATIDARIAFLAARDALVEAAAPLRAPFPWVGELPKVDVLEGLLGAWKRDGVRLVESDALMARGAAILPSAQALFDGVVSDGSIHSWRAALAAAWAAAWVDRLDRESPAIAQLGLGADDRETDRLAARLRELETERRELEIERTLTRIDEAELLGIEPAAKGARRTPQQKVREDILKEARKQRMLMPLRTFVRKFAPHGLLDVVPVWLLSPETMAILFPRAPLFDLVVFDEASQCTVESGLPVLMRAKRVVIAGDEKQMPPSSYFMLGESDEGDEPVAANAPERTDELRDLLTAESLLSLARPRVAHTGLAWHYRCRDESLIAFSNHAMYRGELLTIPSTSGATAPSALHWVAVEDGVYVSGENQPEARRVVDVVDEMLARTPRPTIGVVTFNLKQRRAVLDAIDARCASDPTFRDRWNEATSHDALDERPFVKNLEQVQGDERDVIVFSLGHAPQERKKKGSSTGEQYVPARFGPLGQRGGERRLNVAISRAKAACYLVASFDPSMLSVATATNDGPRLFKHFLEFAHHLHGGRRLEAARVLDLVRSGGRVEATTARSKMPIEGFIPLKTQIALALEAAGIPYEPDVGASVFQVPIAILDPADPTRYALAVLVDDTADRASAFELHVHRPGVLRQRDWRVMPVTAASWYRRSAEIVAEIEALVPGCRGAVSSEIYVRHREEAKRARIPTGVSTPTALPRSPVPSSSDAAAIADPASGPTSAPVESIPAWALAIEDTLFRKALLHLEKHGVLSESDLTSMVGGPRRARLFGGELEKWRTTLPFTIATDGSDGAKVYRVNA